MPDSVVTAISSTSFAMIFVRAKPKKNESLNLTIDCDMVLPQSLKEQPVAHFVKVMP